MCQMYRKAYNLFICNGILFNHESERRGEEFVTRKITRYIAKRLKHNNDTNEIIPPLELGNIYAERDWGYAPEYVNMMYKMMLRKDPGDYVIATGESYSVYQFLQEAFEHIGITIKQEKVIYNVRGTGAIFKDAIVVEKNKNENQPSSFPTAYSSAFPVNSIIALTNTHNNNRPLDIRSLTGDSTKAQMFLGWKPKVNFSELCKIMLLADIEREFNR
jgi:GDPmannose 4,6-dehydratase